MITGASDGIGKQYALTLAEKGLHLFLISRTPAKLENLAKEIQISNDSNHIFVRTFPIDFTLATQENFDHLQCELDKLDSVGMLVNNVGANYSFPMRFLDTPYEVDEALIKVNVTTTTRITKMVLPRMIEKLY